MPIITDLSTDIGQLRLLLGDNTENEGVKPNGTNFTDAEMSYFQQQEGTLSGAAALACETLAHLWNLQPDFEADGLRVNRAAIAAGWLRAAKRFRATARIITLTRQDSL